MAYTAEKFGPETAYYQLQITLMTAPTKRTILRCIHILFALPLIGFIYGPPAETEPYRPYFQYLYMPMVALSGLLMWKGHLLARLWGGDSN